MNEASVSPISSISSPHKKLLRPSILSRSPQTLVVLGVLILMCVVLSFLSPYFFTTANLLNVARQVSLTIIVGMGMTFILTTGGLDISVGSVVALTGCVAAGLVVQGLPLPIAIICAVFLGGAIGALHAVLIVYGPISPVIVTLGTMFSLRGAAFLYTQSISGGTSIAVGLPDSFTTLGQGYISGIPLPVLVAVAIATIFWILFNKSLLGKYTRAIGGNREAAWLSGVKVDRVLFAIYIMTGLLAGLSGVMLASRLGSAQPTTGVGFEFDVVIAVLIGGTSLFGGRGSIIGTVVGAFIIGVLGNGLNLLSVDSFWQQVIKGIVLVLAVLIDSRLRLRRT